jgi:DNA polymerase-4/protein ImuB
VKILCVLLPHFPLRCETRQNPAIKNCPAIITYAAGAAGSAKLVLDGSPELLGLKRDMPIQQAFALNKQVELVQADIPRYWSVFNRILDALEEKSPLVEGTELGCAYLGLDGLEFIYRSDDALIKSVREAVPDSFAAQLGIAEGKFPAYLAARYSPPGGYLKLTSNLKAFLRDLPCDVLPVSVKSRDKLHEFGINTLGQIASLPFSPIQAQFGPEGRLIYELARGHDDTPLIPRLTEPAIEESTVLPSVTVTLEAIIITVESLLSRVFARDILKGRGIRSLILWTKTPGAGHWGRSVRFRELAMDVKSTISRVRFTLERYPQPGPVEELGLRITGLGYSRGRQKSLFIETRAKDHLLDDIKELELRRGCSQVFKIKEVEPWSRIPERRYVLAPVNQ